MIFPYKGISPQLGKNVFIAPSAVVIGNVILEDNVSIWFNAVVRGDMESIIIGKNTNIQDNATVHTDHEYPVVVGDNATIGHNAIIHGCSIGSNTLIGMGSTILNGAIVKEFSVIAAGSTVLENQSLGPYDLFAGVPAIFKKKLPSDIGKYLEVAVNDYLNLSRDYMS